ncbi:MAG: DNA polymerase III subunit delta [Oscillospiraceae bacterium]|nr:DNA polymerase III subunit delta [Oscillospiraceae bacterium]
MAQLREAELKKEIEKGTLSGAYLLYGEEKYTLLQCVEKLVQKVKAAGFADFNLTRFDAADTTADQVADALEALPFFAEQKVVLLRDLNIDTLSPSETERYQKILGELPETSVLILYLPTISLGKRPSAKWKKFLTANSKSLKTVEFPRKSNSELEKYLMDFAERRGCTLSRPLAKWMVQLCGNDLQTLRNEISKVCAYVGGGELSREQIKDVVTINTEAQIFALATALIGGQYEKAYQIVDGLLMQNEEPVAIVAMLSSSYLNLYRAKCMVQSGRSVMELSGPFDYKGKEFLLRNAEQDSSRFSMGVLRRSLDILLEADLALKGGAGSSRLEMKRVVLDTLIAKLLLAAQEQD